MEKDGNKTLENKEILLKKKKIYGVIKLIAFLLILCICLLFLNSILRRKTTEKDEFFAQEEDFDVLFFGSSHVLNGIIPTELWDDYGIISYNMSQSGSYPVWSYYHLLLACKETNPKLVVVDTYFIEKEHKLDVTEYERSYGYLHNLLDSYPISYEKYLAINDICSEDYSRSRIIEYLFNFSMYHARWDELKEKDFHKVNNPTKGVALETAVKASYKKNNFDSVEEYNKEETVNMEYLRKTIEYCKENDIEVLVTYLPCIVNDEQASAAKYVQSICNEYDVNYVNFLNIDVIDYDIDLYEGSTHLNMAGAKKVTDYLGQYIVKNYDIENQKENESYSFWYQDYDEYIDHKIDKLSSNEGDLNSYIMILYGEEDISYEIKISSNQKIEEESTLQKLLLNIQNNYEIDDSVFVGEEGEYKNVKITTWDNRTGEEISTVWF